MEKHGTYVAILAALAACGSERSFEPRSHASGAVTSPGPLTISMTPAGPLVQGTFTQYTVSITNTTPNLITLVDVEADFPFATMNQIPAGCVRAPGGQPEFICGIQSIAPGVTLTFQTQVRPDVAGPLTFVAVTSGNGANINVVQDDENAAPAPTDVQVTGSASTGSPPRGSQYFYTFQVKNDGPYPTFGGVSFTDSLPASLAFVGVITNTGSCTTGQTVNCALGDLAVGAQAVISIIVQAPLVAESIADSASVAIGQQPDRNPANNSVTVTVATK